jgi:hypothetical protein
VIGVRTNSEAFGSWLEQAFSEYRTAEEIGALYSVFVSEADDGRPGTRFHVLYRSGAIVLRTFDLVELARTLRAELDSYLYDRWEDGIYAEATVLTRDGHALLLPNADLFYLTKITRKFERAGVTFPNAGRIAIDPDSGRLIPVPERHTIPDEAFAELARHIPGVETSRESPPVAASAALDAVCVFEVTGDDVFRPPASRAGVVKKLAHGIVNLDALGARALQGLATLTERVPCYEVGWDDPEGMLEGLVAAMHAPAAKTTT